MAKTLKKRVAWFSTLLLGSLFGLASAQFCPSSCYCQTSDGTIDLTSIASASKEVQFTATDPNGYFYQFNPCYGMDGNSYCSSSTGNVAVCQSDNGVNIVVSLLQGEKMVIEGDRRFLQYTDGDAGRTAEVELICNEAATSPSFAALGEDPILAYQFSLTTVCACPDGCSSSGGPPVVPTNPYVNIEINISGPVGLSLMSLFIALIIIYFLVGILVLKFHYHRSGTDLVPQKDFWFALPFLVKDGCIFTFSPCLKAAGIDCGKTNYGSL